MAQAIKSIENDLVAIRLYDDGSADLQDKSTGRRVPMARYALQDDGPIEVGHVWLRSERTLCETWPAHLRARAEGDGLRVTVLDRVHNPAGSIHVDVILDGPWVEFSISDISARLQSVVYPPPLAAQQLVLPHGVGQLIKKPLKKRKFYIFWSHLNMRFFGGLADDGDQGWIGVFEDGHADAGVMVTELAAAPGWLQSLGEWPNTPRKIRYRITTGGYVGIAKAFRAWAKEHGLFKSLDEKIGENPLVGNLAGGRLLSFMQAMPVHPERYEERFEPVPERFREYVDSKLVVNATHADVRWIIDQAFEHGLDKALVMLRGWIRGGYDESHPDIWPPEPALGTIDELRALCELSQPGRLTVGLHDNYQDIYQQSASFPHGVNVLRDGSLQPGGVWHGGQAFILNSQAGLAYLKRNWEQIKTLHPTAMYIDTVTTAQLNQSYEPGNTQTRLDDELGKAALLMYLRRQKIMIGSEEIADFGVPLCDWGVVGHGRVPGETIPLWPLVFHDALMCGRHFSHAPDPASPAPYWLTDMLWGYFRLWTKSGNLRAAWAEETKQFAASLECDRWHGRIATAAMTNHRFLTADGQVEQTEFAPGVAITCNFGFEPVTIDGVEIAAGGHVIR